MRGQRGTHEGEASDQETSTIKMICVILIDFYYLYVG